MKHGWHMLLMLLSFVLLFVLPLLGISRGWSAGIAIAVMIGSHLMMIPRHSRHENHDKNKIKGGSCH